MMRCNPNSDHAVMYVTSAGRPAPECASATRNGTLTIGPPGVMTPAPIAMTRPLKPASRPK
ncbi:MAG: hypothetical protein DMD85_20195 [Candidatus Rokuibacteriota bacterium]|nr:MAG: hypothetical protein DMD85_20195 [Candidatus Rokubacteria bacterium]